MTGTIPYTAVNIPEVMARNSAARDIVAGFASATPTLSAAWRHVGAALADCAALAADVARLADELGTARLDRANLAAAIRATLAANSDGETDPLWYLRDALNAAHSGPETRSGGSDGRLPSDAPAVPPYPPWRHAAGVHDQRRPRPIPRLGRGCPGPASMALPLRARARRRHVGAGRRRRVGCTPRTPEWQYRSLQAAWPPRSRSWRSARGSA